MMNRHTDERVQIEIDQELKLVIPEYLDSRFQDCLEIEHRLVTGGFDFIEALGHRMKGSGGCFGFDEISEIGKSLESAARISDSETIRDAVECLKRYLSAVSVEYVQ